MYITYSEIVEKKFYVCAHVHVYVYVKRKEGRIIKWGKMLFGKDMKGYLRFLYITLVTFL